MENNSDHVAVNLAQPDTSVQTATPIDTGGPAFPWGEHGSHLGGMSIRDHFAALAMQAIIAHPCGHAGKWDLAARDAYEAADAMLKVRYQP